MISRGLPLFFPENVLVFFSLGGYLLPPDEMDSRCSTGAIA